MFNTQNDRNASEYINHGKENHEYGEDIDDTDFHFTKIELKAQGALLIAMGFNPWLRRKAEEFPLQPSFFILWALLSALLPTCPLP